MYSNIESIVECCERSTSNLNLHKEGMSPKFLVQTHYRCEQYCLQIPQMSPYWDKLKLYMKLLMDGDRGHTCRNQSQVTQM